MNNKHDKHEASGARVRVEGRTRQSPHYGFLEGDGDLIFNVPAPEASDKEEEIDDDVEVQVPMDLSSQSGLPEETSSIDLVKDYLPDARHRIRLDDLVSREIRAVLHGMGEEQFPLQTATVTAGEFAERLRRYERLLSQLLGIVVLVARWATEEDQPILARIVARLADSNQMRGGTTAWLGLRWYPIMLLMYSGGISALACNNYRSLATLLTTPLVDRTSGRGPYEAVVPTVQGLLDVERQNMFKRLPGHERNHVPRSEYLFKALQPAIEDQLLLGSSYEDLFDRFEIFYALAFAEISTRTGTVHIWGPPGRFAWKHNGMSGVSPYYALLAEAKQFGNDWTPLRSGLFQGSSERFIQIASAYGEILDSLHWY